MSAVGRALQACEPCKARKKKCDRLYPACTTCTEKFLKCNYEEDKTRNEVLQLRRQVETLTALIDSQSKNRKYSIPIGLFPGSLTHYPIQSAWYMPSLIQHYWGLCFPSYSQVKSCDDYRLLAGSWMEAVFSDACMFHAALFAASSHIDVLRNELDNPVTHHHRCSTRQLLLCSISSGRPLQLTTIAATTFLWHYESMNCHVHEAVIHKKGLEQMVKSKGGLSEIGFGGFLAHLIVLINIGDMIMNPSVPICSNFASLAQPEIPVTLLSAALSRSKHELIVHGISAPLIDLLYRVHQTTIQFQYQKQEISTSSPFIGIEEDILNANSSGDMAFSDNPGGEDYFQLACYCAANIHLRCLQQIISFSTTDNQEIVSQLKQYLTLLDDDAWLHVNRETYIWVCFTAAAAAREGKSWFLAKVGPPTMSLRDDASSLLKLGALQFCKLLRYLDKENTENQRSG